MSKLSKKKVSAIVWAKLEAKVRELGGTDEDLCQLSLPEGDEKIGKMARIVVPPPSLSWFQLTR